MTKLQILCGLLYSFYSDNRLASSNPHRQWTCVLARLLLEDLFFPMNVVECWLMPCMCCKKDCWYSIAAVSSSRCCCCSLADFSATSLSSEPGSCVWNQSCVDQVG
ncbi:unnamed protein product [Angiostrongylus costaricensis]|uniref:Secreted protein n=1 Tax=Angiostrongylus costaricensis TaxID=334426 RepID=A0A0R3PKA5_ANGCS|nr:unnamed protein product [Angiostrongylus costaricensis]